MNFKGIALLLQGFFFVFWYVRLIKFNDLEDDSILQMNYGSPFKLA